MKPDDIEGMPVTFHNSLLKPAGSNDDNFIDCIWDNDPMFYTVREDYFFDYRLRKGSPAIGSANPAFMDKSEAASQIIMGCLAARLPISEPMSIPNRNNLNQ